jgi:hypothetical protein
MPAFKNPIEPLEPKPAASLRRIAIDCTDADDHAEKARVAFDIRPGASAARAAVRRGSGRKTIEARYQNSRALRVAP